ncbi:hypothetical protein FB451DRAFT_1568975 [Mycena latifolia]|nr:hypothetical protein FB451DRAFT_1568967 [Mycena latifolia]KAJ7442476.1 hypothetical protein FB451DRAFT_1568975 [Mycena latifolia]
MIMLKAPEHRRRAAPPCKFKLYFWASRERGYAFNAPCNFNTISATFASQTRPTIAPKATEHRRRAAPPGKLKLLQLVVNAPRASCFTPDASRAPAFRRADSLMRVVRARPASFDLIFWESRERGHSAPPEILEVPRAACASEAADIFIEGYACSPRAARCGDYRRRRAPWSRALILGAPSKFVESHALNWIKPRGLEHRR